MCDYNDHESYEKISSILINTIDILVNNTQGPIAGDISVSINDYQCFDLLFKNIINNHFN